MADLNGTDDVRRIDELIDRAVARRVTREAAGAPGTAATRAGADESLITELSELTAIDWPADETGDRIAEAVGASLPAGHRPARAWRAAATYARPLRQRWRTAAAAAAAALLVAGVFQLTGSPRPSAGPGPGPSGAAASRSTPGTSPASRGPGLASPPAGRHQQAPTWLTAMRVVAGTGALRAVGAVSSGSNFLTCATMTVCYVLGSANGGKQVDIVRSLNGGASWARGEPLSATGAAPQEFTAQLSCPRPLTCFSPYGTSLLETGDGFAHYAVQPVNVPSISGVTEVSCPTRLDCVAAVDLGSKRKTFAYSHDGGVSWAEASAGMGKLGLYDIIAGLHCNSRGACIAADIVGTVQNPMVAALSSTNGGRTWIRSRNYSIVEQEQYMVSCGDAHSCLIGSNDGYLAWVDATSSGRVGIRVMRFPKSWGQEGDAVGCATGPDCFVVTGAGAIEATRDAGRTWTSAPVAPGRPQDNVVYLSCPVAAGCVALATGATGGGSSWVVLSNLRSSR